MADHPVKVPAELAEQWSEDARNQLAPYCVYIANRAAQWGADQELEACRQWLDINGVFYKFIDGLLTARRPKPPTLAEQGLKALSAVVDALRLGFPGESMDGFHIQNLTDALNRLAELEAQQ